MLVPKNWLRLVALGAFVHALAMTGCAGKKTNDGSKAGDDTKPAEPVPKAQTQPDAQPTPVSITPSGVGPGDEDLSKVQPDFKMTAQEWKAIAEDETNRLKYKGKVVEVTAPVLDLSHSEDQPENTNLYLNDLNAAIGVGVHVVVKGKDAWKLVLPGQAATLRGRYSPDSGRRLNAQIISVTGQPCETVTVEELVAATKTVAEAKNKYGDREIFVLTGKVLAVQKDTLTDVTGRVELVMTPSGAKRPLIVGPASSELDKRLTTIKAGQTIRVLCTLLPRESENRTFAGAILEVR